MLFMLEPVRLDLPTSNTLRKCSENSGVIVIQDSSVLIADRCLAKRASTDVITESRIGAALPWCSFVNIGFRRVTSIK